MPCYSPLEAFQPITGGRLFFYQGEKSISDARKVTVACGQCIGCRLERSRQWAVRCLHEAKMHDANSFITLTYAEEKLPEWSSLRYEDFQLFMKRFRKRVSPVRIRFYMAGEYGETFGRPHYHACIFGFDFPDKLYFSKSPGGSKMYTSKMLEDLWPHGFSSVGEVTFESAAYVARYCMKKITGEAAVAHYQVVNLETGEIFQRAPEFNRMSLGGRQANGGIGASWLSRFLGDVYPHGYVVVNGKTCSPPRYYDQRFEKVDAIELEQLKYRRYLEALPRAADNSLERLAVKQKVAHARLSKLKRSI